MRVHRLSTPIGLLLLMSALAAGPGCGGPDKAEFSTADAGDELDGFPDRMSTDVVDEPEALVNDTAPDIDVDSAEAGPGDSLDTTDLADGDCTEGGYLFDELEQSADVELPDIVSGDESEELDAPGDEPECTPSCDGKECSDDGCGGDCGDCPSDTICSPEGLCVTPPGCGDGLCDPALGEDCFDCDQDCGQCKTGCQPDPGLPGCNGCPCEDCVCAADSFCCQNEWDSVCVGHCLECGACTCPPDCEDKQCGPDGCGGSCGLCPAGHDCASGQCQTVCIPDCGGKECGTNECGGVCATCPEGENCLSGSCFDSLSCLDVLECVLGCNGAGTACLLDCLEQGGGAPQEELLLLYDCMAPLCPGQSTDCMTTALEEQCSTEYQQCADCSPDCQDQECGSDGCGGSCGTCQPGSCCDNFKCKPVCLPDCDDKVCGSDGCAGSCGICMAGEECNGGVCLPDCLADCSGVECGPDGCGGSCGMCEGGHFCEQGMCGTILYNCMEALTCWLPCKIEGNNLCADACAKSIAPQYEGFLWGIFDCIGKNMCEIEEGGWTLEAVKVNCPVQLYECLAGCVPDCEGKVCGSDGCSGSCGECLPETECKEGVCSFICVPDCEDKDCGSDGCSGSCGVCNTGYECDGTNCFCLPQCIGKECGPDGCGATCGDCQPGFDCGLGGKCCCAADCPGKECGPDGCGGDCGTCGPDEFCTPNGSCFLSDCIPGQRDCDGMTVLECDEDNEWEEDGPCPQGTYCDAGDCFPWVCVPGETVCADGSVAQCAESGSAWLAPQACLQNMVCAEGECVTPCEPGCDGKECGPDLCGGTCGECGENTACITNLCLQVGGECDDGNDQHWDGCTEGHITEFAGIPGPRVGSGDLRSPCSRTAAIWWRGSAGAKGPTAGPPRSSPGCSTPTAPRRETSSWSIAGLPACSCTRKWRHSLTTVS